jgi:hypothetical protein
MGEKQILKILQIRTLTVEEKLKWLTLVVRQSQNVCVPSSHIDFEMARGSTVCGSMRSDCRRSRAVA